MVAMISSCDRGEIPINYSAIGPMHVTCNCVLLAESDPTVPSRNAMIAYGLLTLLRCSTVTTIRGLIFVSTTNPLRLPSVPHLLLADQCLVARMHISHLARSTHQALDFTQAFLAAGASRK